MKWTTLQFIIISGILIACNGQPKKQTDQNITLNKAISFGDTVKETGHNIMVVYQDKRNIYWFGSWETGLYRYDGKTIINYSTKHGLPHNRVDEIKEDQLGNIYITTCYPSSAITKFDGQTFTVLKAIPTNDWKLQSNDLWFKHSFQNEKVYRYDGKILHELQLPKPPKLSNSFEIYSIYQDIKGNIWFGTNPDGVCRYNGNSFDWITEDDVTEFGKGGANGVRSIVEDRQGDFWFNTEYKYSVYSKVTLDVSKFYTRQPSIGSLDGKINGSINEYLSVVKDKNNDLWMATYRDGVWKYDGSKITHYPVQKDSQDISVFSIYKDLMGDLWLGTHENGAFKFDGKSFIQVR